MVAMKLEVTTEVGVREAVIEIICEKFPNSLVDDAADGRLIIHTGATEMSPADVRHAIAMMPGVKDCLWCDGGYAASLFEEEAGAA